MTERHVVPVEDGWQVKKKDAQRPSAKAGRKAEAIDRANQIVAKAGGGRVVIHDAEGPGLQTRIVAAATDDKPRPDSRPDDTSQKHTGEVDQPAGDRSTPHHRHAQRAAHHAAERNRLHLKLPLVGTVTLPPTDQLAYLGGITGLAALGILEWPVAAILGAGHVVATNRNNKNLADFGEALEKA
jgi:hypothetical protein